MIKDYRETNYDDEYQIEYVWDGNHYDIYCHDHPHNPYSDKVTDCHLYSSGEVCVAAGREPTTLDRAKAIAYLWMEGYSSYVRTGRFPFTGGRVTV